MTTYVSPAASISHQESLSHVNTIPVIDMQDWYASDPVQRKKFVNELDTAFHTVGFVAVINPKIDMDKLDRAYEQSRLFFANDDKWKLYKPERGGQRGYVPGETAKGSNEKDLKEFFHWGRKNNIWPEAGGLESAMCDLLAELEAYEKPFLEAIAEAMGQPADFLWKMTKEGESLARALHYFPAEKGKEVGKKHTDIDIIAIIPRATCEGLQVQLPGSEEWIDARVPEGAFIINAGDMLEAMTNGYYMSAVHRILSPGEDKHRYSMVHFVHPRDEDQVGPLQQYITLASDRQHHPFGTREEYLWERLIELFDDLPKEKVEKFVASGFIDRRIAIGKPSMPCIQKLRAMGYDIKLAAEQSHH